MSFKNKYLCVFLLQTLATAVVHAQTPSTSSGQAASTGSGQAFPSKTLRIIVGFPPGGATDITARAVAQKLTESIGRFGLNYKWGSPLVARY